MYQGNKLTLQPLDDRLVELHFNAAEGAVNIFDKETVTELGEALDRLEQDSQVRGLLVTSGKSVFIAGANIHEFGDVFGTDHATFRHFVSPNNRNILRLEHLHFPVVAAIGGAAMGGGLEFCLGCDYRVMADKAVVGLPETTLGIIPGWGGTVRLPRVIGFEAAATLVASGRACRAEEALELGLVDAVVSAERLRDEALTLLKRCAVGEEDYEARRQRKHAPLPHSEAELETLVSASRVKVGKLAGRHWKAPLVALDSMAKSALLPLPEALEVEFEHFYDVTSKAEARAMVGNFINDQALGRLARQYASAATTVEQVTVLGAGVMGGGIAYQNALKGYPVMMKDIHQPALDVGMAEAEALVGKRVERGQLNETQAREVLSRIVPTLDYEGLENSQLIVEAVVENANIKRTVLAEVESKAAEDAALASNTSTISIDDLAGALQRPENFCGMHFFNPVHAMPLVEVVRGSKTSDRALATTVAHALAMGKKVLVVRDCPAFFVNRTLFPLVFAFDMLVSEGIDFETIDAAVEAWGMPMGPAYLMDVVGIDVAVHCFAALAEGYPDRMAPDLARSALYLMAQQERYGQKNGKGFYAYPAAAGGRVIKTSDPSAHALIDEHITAEKGSLPADDIALRIMLPMAIEAARALEEEIIGSAAEGDMGLLYGLGFPRGRGGIFRWMDELGLAEVCRQADRFKELGKLYSPTDTMRAMAESGTRYYR